MSNGDIYKIVIHSKPFFPNFKILEKFENPILFRNLQLVRIEKVPLEASVVYILQTTENTYFTGTNNLKEETASLLSLVKDKNFKENVKISIDKHLRRYKYPSNESFDEEMLDTFLDQEQNKKSTNFVEEP